MSHTYKYKGHLLPSVTTIIGEYSNKDALIQWAANSSVEYIKEHWEEMQGMGIGCHLNAARFHYRALSKEALDIGSEFHAIAERIYKEKVIYESDNEKVRNCVDAFENWILDNDVMMIATERSVYGDGWAGTLDLECMLNGVHTIVDYKTSRAIYPATMGMQLAAYLSVTDAEAAGVLRVDKETGEYEYKSFTKAMLKKYLKRFNKRVETYFEDHPAIRRKAGR